MATKSYGNYTQPDPTSYKAQFDGTTATGGASTANSTVAKQLGSQISGMTDKLETDKATVQRNVATGSLDLASSENAYATDIGTLHNLERQYAAATGDTGNLQRLQDNPDQTGLGTTDELLAEAHATNSQGQLATDKDFTFTGIGSSDGADSQVTAQLNGSSSTTQSTTGFQGATTLEGSSSGGASGDTYWDVKNGVYDDSAGHS